MAYITVHVQSLRLQTLGSVFLKQGGTLLAPTTEYMFQVQPTDPARGVFSWNLEGNPAAGTMNYVTSWGYNTESQNPALPAIRGTFETDFNDGVNHSIEMHWGQYSIPAGWNGTLAAFSGRPFEANALNNGVQNSGCGIHSPWPTLTAAFHVEDSFDGFQPLVIDRSAATFRSSTAAFSSPTGKMITGENNAMAGMGYARADAAIRAYSGWAGSLGSGLVTGVAMFTGVSGTGLYIGRTDDNFSNRREMISVDDGYNGVQLCSFGGAAPLVTDFGAGVGVVGVSKAQANPSTNPAGVVVYSEHTSGALKVRDAIGGDSNVSGGFFTQAMADADQTVSAANSASRFYRATGANTAIRHLTITLPPSSGTMVVVRNDCTVNGITVQFATGAATGTILPGTAAIVCGDGANAFILGTMT